MIGPAVLLDFMGDISKKKHRITGLQDYKNYRMSSGVLLKIEVGIYARNEAPKVPSIELRRCED